MNDAIVHFTLGSSPVLCLFPLLILYGAYNKLTDEEKENSRVSFSVLALVLPIIYGILFAMLYSVGGFIPRKTPGAVYLRYVLCGAIATSLVSMLLEYVFKVYDEWFGIENAFHIHVGVGLVFLVIMYTIGQWIRKQVLYGPTPTPSSSSSSPPPVMKPPSSSSGKSDSASKFDAIASKNK